VKKLIIFFPLLAGFALVDAAAEKIAGSGGEVRGSVGKKNNLMMRGF